MATLKNITFSASPDSIHRARLRATLEHSTLNEKFREWLDSYALRKPSVDEFAQLMKRFRRVNAGRRFTRAERNERATSR